MDERTFHDYMRKQAELPWSTPGMTDNKGRWLNASERIPKVDAIKHIADTNMTKPYGRIAYAVEQ